LYRQKRRRRFKAIAEEDALQAGRGSWSTRRLGLYFQEDIDISAIIGVVFMILFLTSLVFLVLWTVLKDDIQGASGVSAYIVAVASMFGHLDCDEEQELWIGYALVFPPRSS
jgi:hypothetical protein